MKKIFLIALFGFMTLSFFGNKTYADDQSYMLKQEYFENAYLVRIYDYDGKRVENDIELPMELREKVYAVSQDQQTIEAKKQLYAMYKILGLNVKMDELMYKNILVINPHNVNIQNPSIQMSSDLQKQAKSDAIQMEQYYEQEKSKWDHMNAEQKKQTYDTDLDIYQDYVPPLAQMTPEQKSKFIKQQSEVNAGVTEMHQEKQKEMKSKKSKTNYVPEILKWGTFGIIMMALIGGIIILGIRQKRG